MSEHSRAPSVRSPASRLGGSSQVLMLEMSSPDEVTQVIKGVKGLKSDYYIFNSFGELQREATEHSVSAGGSSRGSALWPSPPLWRYALLFWLLCSVTISCLSQQSLLFLTLLPFFPLHSLFCFPACPPPFAALPLELASTTFLILHLLTGQKINTSFLFFFLLTSLCLPSQPEVHFPHLPDLCPSYIHKASNTLTPPSVDRLSLGNKSSWCGQRRVYPLTEWRVGPRVCVLLINRPSKWPALLQPLGVHQHNFTLAPQTPLCSLLPVESCSRLGFNTLAICPAAFPPSCL